MRGVNEAWLAGNVSGPIQFGETGNGDPACSFMLAVDKKNAPTTWVRVNVYGALVRICKMKLDKGVYVQVTGELMNRVKTGTDGDARTLTEVRAEDIVFHSSPMGDGC